MIVPSQTQSLISNHCSYTVTQLILMQSAYLSAHSRDEVRAVARPDIQTISFWKAGWGWGAGMDSFESWRHKHYQE